MKRKKFYAIFILCALLVLGTFLFYHQTLATHRSGPKLRVDTLSYSFSAEQSGSNPPGLGLTIFNDGTQNLIWNVSTNASWLTARRNLTGGETSGIEAPGGKSIPPLVVSINITGLTVGEYNSAVSVTSNEGSVSIPVKLTVIQSSTKTGIVLIPDNSSSIWSTYSPFVLRLSDRYRMYFGRDEDIAGKHVDRIYISENFGDPINPSHWSQPQLVLSPGGIGESAWIHDPAVVNLNQPLLESWHIYYTGTSDTSGLNNAIFHAVSADGVNFQKRGRVTINNLLPLNPDPSLRGAWGHGEPSIIFENGRFLLYFFYDGDFSLGTVFLAEGTDGHNFNFVGPVNNVTVSHPETRSFNGTYFLTASENFSRFIQATSSNYKSFGQSKEIFSRGLAGSWDSLNIATPDYLPQDGLLFYGGTKDAGTNPMFNSQIGVVSISPNSSPTLSSCDQPEINKFRTCIFDNTDFTGNMIARTDTVINFLWGAGSPDPQIGPDTFSARWLGNFSFQNGTYEFTVTSDDGFKLFIDGVLVLDKWFDQGQTTYKVSKSLAQGTRTIKLEYYENFGGATLALSWKQTGFVELFRSINPFANIYQLLSWFFR